MRTFSWKARKKIIWAKSRRRRPNKVSEIQDNLVFERGSRSSFLRPEVKPHWATWHVEPPTLLAEARQAAEAEGTAFDQLIILALAEKVSAMRTEEYFEERARRADPARSAGFWLA